MDILTFKFLRFSLIDLIDVIVVAFIFYKFFTLLKGTRAAQMIFGLMMLFVVSFFAYWFQLQGLMWLFSNLATVGFIVLVILFQPEIRGALAKIGYSRVMKYFYRVDDNIYIDEIVKAAKRMSELKHGALIVIERNVGLKNFMQSGKTINSEISAEVITTIFTPYSPLHDGALIISENRISAAGCMLPLSQNPRFLHIYGMRHKAAIGVTEESDSVCIAVSEENGQISIAREGSFIKTSPEDLKSLLIDTLKNN